MHLCPSVTVLLVVCPLTRQQVDNNVTRHLDSTLKRDDWDVLILHYLGLDHIGHISGPHSSLIGPKLLEMDDVLKKIHAALISKVGVLSFLLFPSLLFLSPFCFSFLACVLLLYP